MAAFKRRLPRRRPEEIEEEMERVSRKLEATRTALERERTFAKKGWGRANQSLTEALKKRMDALQSRAKKLAEEMRAHYESSAAIAGSCVSAPRAVPAVRSDREASGTDRTLAQAARMALKKGSFANASERAVFQKIVSDLSEGGAELQFHVLERLGELKSGAALPIFAAGVRHQSEEVRVAALRGVLAMRDPSTRRILAETLADRSHRVRVWAVRGLYALDDPGLDELLCTQLQDPHPSVRRTAATYLSWKRIPGAERHLVWRLHDVSPEVRAAVVTALGQCGSDGSVFKLMSMLKDEVAPVREAAVEALKRLLGTAPQIDVQAGDEERQEAIGKLKAWWRQERVRRLIGPDAEADLESPEDASPSDLDLPGAQEASAPSDLDHPAAAQEPLAEAEGLDDGLAPSTGTEEAVPSGLDDAPEEAGLDAEPDLGGELDDVDSDFLGADEPAEGKE